MKIAVISLSREGAEVAMALRRSWPEADVYLHEAVTGYPDATPFKRMLACTAELFPRYRGLVFIAPCGAVVRALAPLVVHKTTDPGVVVVDVMARYAVSLLGGHEGGANALAIEVANRLGAEPVISTTTDALKTVIVGIGCRKGTSAARLEAAVRQALDLAAVTLDQVACLASADVKRHEPGLIEAARTLGVPLRILPSAELRRCRREFTESEFVKTKVNLPAVAEPSALLAGRRTELILRRQVIDGITVAIARENSMQLG